MALFVQLVIRNGGLIPDGYGNNLARVILSLLQIQEGQLLVKERAQILVNRLENLLISPGKVWLGKLTG